MDKDRHESGKHRDKFFEDLLNKCTKDERLNGRTYHNEKLGFDRAGFPLNFAFYEEGDEWQTNVRGEEAWVIGIRYAVCDGDVDGYIVAVENDVFTYSKERLSELNGSKPPREGYVRSDYTVPQTLSRNERRRNRRHRSHRG